MYKIYWLCCLNAVCVNHHAYCSLKQLLKLTLDDPLTKTPKKSDLLNRVASRALNKWERIVLQLDLEQHQLDAIQSQDPIKCYSVVFDLWKKKTDPPFTWATVVEALRAPIVGENDLAEEIDKWLRSRHSYKFIAVL